jgi:hypothetical protein
LLAGASLALPAFAQEKEKERPKTDEKKPADASTQTQSLENSRWNVKVVPDKAATAKGEKEYSDTLVFSQNKVSLKDGLGKGYKPSNYTVTKSGTGFKVTADQGSDMDGKVALNADISGQTIKGTLVCTKKDGTILNYTFDGRQDMSADATDRKMDKEKGEKKEGKTEENKEKNEGVPHRK